MFFYPYCHKVIHNIGSYLHLGKLSLNLPPTVFQVSLLALHLYIEEGI